jgi:hypothetical protein
MWHDDLPQKTNVVQPTVMQYKLQFGVIFQENKKNKRETERVHYILCPK